jgi:hypothetical protein
VGLRTYTDIHTPFVSLSLCSSVCLYTYMYPSLGSERAFSRCSVGVRVFLQAPTRDWNSSPPATYKHRCVCVCVSSPCTLYMHECVYKLCLLYLGFQVSVYRASRTETSVSTVLRPTEEECCGAELPASAPISQTTLELTSMDSQSAPNTPDSPVFLRPTQHGLVAQ